MIQSIKHFDPNDLFYTMHEACIKTLPIKKLTICNEGGTRAGKTFDTFDLITAICDDNRGANLDIYILRDTLTNNRDYTLKDWKKLQLINGINLIGKDTPKPEYRLFGNNILFRGLDDESNTEGYPSDILFFNEVLELEKSQVDGLIMRCRKLIIFDWNPKLTTHWVFDYEGKPDVLFTRTTFLNNKHLEQSVIDGIKSYEPTEENIKNKTADLFRWRVYGLGLRTDQEGNVFNDSQLNKFDSIDIVNQTIVAWCDVADQGPDSLCYLVGLIDDKKIYIIDVVFTSKSSDYYIPLIIEMMYKYNISMSVFESNNQGLMLTKLIKKTINPNNDKDNIWMKRIKAIPNCKNKHSRIVVQAETNIVHNFYFKSVRTGMYKEYYESLLQYKYDRSIKKDDAPDATAGLSIITTNLK